MDIKDDDELNKLIGVGNMRRLNEYSRDKNLFVVALRLACGNLTDGEKLKKK